MGSTSNNEYIFIKYFVSQLYSDTTNSIEPPFFSFLQTYHVVEVLLLVLGFLCLLGISNILRFYVKRREVLAKSGVPLLPVWSLHKRSYKIFYWTHLLALFLTCLLMVLLFQIWLLKLLPSTFYPYTPYSMYDYYQTQSDMPLSEKYPDFYRDAIKCAMKHPSYKTITYHLLLADGSVIEFYSVGTKKLSYTDWLEQIVSYSEGKFGSFEEFKGFVEDKYGWVFVTKDLTSFECNITI